MIDVGLRFSWDPSEFIHVESIAYRTERRRASWTEDVVGENQARALILRHTDIGEGWNGAADESCPFV